MSITIYSNATHTQAEDRRRNLGEAAEAAIELSAQTHESVTAEVESPSDLDDLSTALYVSDPGDSGEVSWSGGPYHTDVWCSAPDNTSAYQWRVSVVLRAAEEVEAPLPL